MKKSLIALAALAATASFAQSSVTISGLVDIGYRNLSAPLGGSTSGGFQNGSATSAILFTGTEDLGGGMKANFRYEINPDLVGGAGFTGNVLASSGVLTSNGANGYNFVGLSGGFGDVKFGRLNTASLGAWATGSVFGTALGSGYGTNGNMYTVASSSAANFLQTAPTRFNGAVEYTTPKINNFTGRLLYVPKVNETGAGSTDSTTTGLAGVNRAGVTDMGLAYNDGPLNVSVAQQQVKYGTAVNALVNPGTSSNVTDGNYKLTTLAANYTMGAATVYAAYWTEKQATVAATAVKIDATAYMLGAKYVMGATTLMASYSQRDDKSTANVTASSGTVSYADADRKIYGIGADYALSKRTSLYARYEFKDPNTNRSGTNTTSGSATTYSSFDATKTTAIGVRHTF